MPKSNFAIKNGELTKYTGNQKHVVIPAGVKSILPGVFANCIAMESVVIPEGVTRIGERAFDDCACLKSVSIPETVTYIGWLAFRRTLWLEEYAGDFVVAGDGYLIRYNGLAAPLYESLHRFGGPPPFNKVMSST